MFIGNKTFIGMLLILDFKSEHYLKLVSYKKLNFFL